MAASEPGRRTRVLVVTYDKIGPRMAGPAIRSYELARALAREHDVLLACRHEPERDGDGFEGAEDAAGQGLKNMRARAESIEGGFSMRSTPGRGTALEVVLRT